MKAIGFNEINTLSISPESCYEWVEEMLQNKKDAFLPPKIHMPLDGNIFCNVMPSYVREEGGLIGGVKIVTRYPERTPSLDSRILIFDANNGNFLALLDGNWITAMRTGGVAAHSITLFAKEDFNEIGIIGLGNTARSSLLILLSKFPQKEFNIRLLRYKDQAELFIERFVDYENIHFTVVEDVKDAIKGAHVVLSCATYFDKDICPNNCFDEGVLVVPVHTRGFTNCDLFFDKVFADDTGHVDHFKYFSQFKSFAEVSDVLAGKSPGRQSDSERILVYNIGLSIHDIHYAYKIYSLMKEDKGLFYHLPEVCLSEPKEKFWV